MFNSLSTFSDRHPILNQWKCDLETACRKHYLSYFVYGIIGLLVSIATGFVSKDAQVTGFVFGAFLIPAIVIILWYFALAPARVVRFQKSLIEIQQADIDLYLKKIDDASELQHEVQELTERLSSEKDFNSFLSERLEPKVEWFITDKIPCIELQHYTGEYHHVVRIGVTNISGTTVRGALVKLKEVNGDPYHQFVGFEFPLRLAQQRMVNLLPGESDYFSVAYYPHQNAKIRHSRVIRLCVSFTGSIIPSFDPTKRHSIVLGCYGNGQSEDRRFDLFVDDRDILRLIENPKQKSG